MTPNDFVYWYEFYDSADVATWIVLAVAATSLVILIVERTCGFGEWNLPKWLIPLVSTVVLTLVVWKSFGMTGAGFFQRNAPPELQRRVVEWTALKRAIHTGPGKYREGYDRDYVIANWLAGVPEPVVWRDAKEDRASSR